MAKRIVVINGHHNTDEFHSKICKTYIESAIKAGSEVKYIEVSKLNIDFVLKDVIVKDIHPDITNSQQIIKWADHLVWVFPVWWFSMPSKMKAFIENVFVKDFAYKYKENKNFVDWDRYLVGKTARIISVTDSPNWYYRYLLGQPTVKSIRASMNFAGIKPVKVTHFSIYDSSYEAKGEKWLKKVAGIASKKK